MVSEATVMEIKDPFIVEAYDGRKTNLTKGMNVRWLIFDFVLATFGMFLTTFLYMQEGFNDYVLTSGVATTVLLWFGFLRFSKYVENYYDAR